MQEIHKHAIICIAALMTVIAAVIILSPVALTHLDFEIWVKLVEWGII